MSDAFSHAQAMARRKSTDRDEVLEEAAQLAGRHAVLHAQCLLPADAVFGANSLRHNAEHRAAIRCARAIAAGIRSLKAAR
jgi:hypothetical protein